MNNFLANLMRYGNGFVALLIILGFAYLFAFFPPTDELQVTGLGLGLIVGVIVATVICGTLAIFITIRTELIEIRGLLGSKTERVREDFMKDFQKHQ